MRNLLPPNATLQVRRAPDGRAFIELELPPSRSPRSTRPQRCRRSPDRRL